ncbi:MAG: HAD family hydrolase [Candidatus Hydrogenedentes bacterium]|nr:HAD family hydrolase [Candidatus Hydrogenedentota bacterium]
MSKKLLPGTEIEIIHEIPRGQFKHVLFDFDGTISLLREGWQGIMAPVCVEMICGTHPPTPEIIRAVDEMIDETTGIQTIFQMERLVEMIRKHGLVPEDEILDPAGYKQIYNDRLMVPVRERLAKLAAGELTAEQVTVRGALRFLELLRAQGVHMYVFSGTDRDDVRNECAKVGAAPFFEEIWGALPSKEEYSKEKVIREIIAQHDLHGTEVLAIGDGPVELRNVKEQGGIALGVCSDEVRGEGWDETKHKRLLRAGADILVPDFSEAEKLVEYLFPK